MGLHREGGLPMGFGIKDNFLIRGSVRQRQEQTLSSSDMNVSGLYQPGAHKADEKG